MSYYTAPVLDVTEAQIGTGSQVGHGSSAAFVVIFLFCPFLFSLPE